MQGFNMGRYVPPDVEGTTSANKLHKKHPLGQRASKLSSQGVLTVRFEMPFPIWCSGCAKPTIIGQGVRFNAEKKRVGRYYTTTVWSFRFRHAECGGWIEMRTDPKNTAYVVVSGAKKRDTGEEKDGEGRKKEIFQTEGERLEQRKSAFASLEKTIEDREALTQATRRIDGLRDLSARQWDDPYAQNQKLRRAFRAGRKEREKAAAATEDLKDRMGLGLNIMPETEEDARRAALIDFGALDHDGDDGTYINNATLSKPLFASASASAQVSSTSLSSASSTAPTSTAKMATSRLKSEKKALQRKENLVSELMSNTRAAQDPFLQSSRSTSEGKTPRLVLGVKRKHADVTRSSPAPTPAAAAAVTASAADANATPSSSTVSVQAPTLSGALVAYDSD